MKMLVLERSTASNCAVLRGQARNGTMISSEVKPAGLREKNVNCVTVIAVAPKEFPIGVEIM